MLWFTRKSKPCMMLIQRGTLRSVCMTPTRFSMVDGEGSTPVCRYHRKELKKNARRTVGR